MPDFSLKYIIDADGKKARSELDSVDRKIAKLGGTISETSGLSVSQLNAIAIGIGAIAGAAVTATAALFSLTKQAAEYGSTIFDATEKTGLHAESLSAMDFAAKQSSTSLEQITAGIAKFAKTVGAAGEGSKEAAASMKSLGIDPQDALNDLDGALAKVFKRIADAKPGIEQITLAQKAFGKSGAELLPFIKSFDGDLNKLIRTAKDLGVTINDDAARAADEFGDTLDMLSSQLDGITRTIGQAFMPVFLDMAKATSKWAKDNKGEIKSWADTAANMVRGAIAYWKELNNAIERYNYLFGLAGKVGLGNVNPFGGVGALLANKGAQVAAANNVPSAIDYSRPGDFKKKSKFDTADDATDAAKDAEKRRREAEALAKRDLTAAISLESKNLDTIQDQMNKTFDRIEKTFKDNGIVGFMLKDSKDEVEIYKRAIQTSIEFLEQLENRSRGALTENEQALLSATQLERREKANLEINQRLRDLKAEGLKQEEESYQRQGDELVKINEQERERYDLLKKQNEEREESVKSIFGQGQPNPDSAPAVPGLSGGASLKGTLLDAIGLDQDLEDNVTNRTAIIGDAFTKLGGIVGDAVGNMA